MPELEYVVQVTDAAQAASYHRDILPANHMYMASKKGKGQKGGSTGAQRASELAAAKLRKLENERGSAQGERMQQEVGDNAFNQYR